MSRRLVACLAALALAGTALAFHLRAPSEAETALDADGHRPVSLEGRADPCLRAAVGLPIASADIRLGCREALRPPVATPPSRSPPTPTPSPGGPAAPPSSSPPPAASTPSPTAPSPAPDEAPTAPTPATGARPTPDAKPETAPTTKAPTPPPSTTPTRGGHSGAPRDATPADDRTAAPPAAAPSATGSSPDAPGSLLERLASAIHSIVAPFAQVERSGPRATAQALLASTAPPVIDAKALPPTPRPLPLGAADDAARVTRGLDEPTCDVCKTPHASMGTAVHPTGRPADHDAHPDATDAPGLLTRMLTSVRAWSRV